MEGRNRDQIKRNLHRTHTSWSAQAQEYGSDTGHRCMFDGGGPHARQQHWLSSGRDYYVPDPEHGLFYPSWSRPRWGTRVVDWQWVRAFNNFLRIKCQGTSFFNFSGLLARAKWFRVILDEAQFIRNRSADYPPFSSEGSHRFYYYRNTRSSRSVAYLRATYRWMLTGTPVTNTL